MAAKKPVKRMTMFQVFGRKFIPEQVRQLLYDVEGYPEPHSLMESDLDKEAAIAYCEIFYPTEPLSDTLKLTRYKHDLFFIIDLLK